MDTTFLVEKRKNEGQKLVAHLVRAGFDVTAAFWARLCDGSLWYLYLCSTSVEPTTIGTAYQVVYQSVHSIPLVVTGLMEIKLVPAKSPITQDALELRDAVPWKTVIKTSGQRLGDLAIEEVYFYPPVSGHMARPDILQTILNLMSRSGDPQLAQVTLRNGSTISGIPVALKRHPGNSVDIVLLNASTQTEQAVSVDDVDNVL
jgi:hypothetical protein